MASIGYASFISWRYCTQNILKDGKVLSLLLANLKALFSDELSNLSMKLPVMDNLQNNLGTINMWKQVDFIPPKFKINGKGYIYFSQTTKFIFKKISELMLGSEIKGLYSYIQEFFVFVENPPKIKFHKNIESLLDIIKASLLYQIDITGNYLKEKSEHDLDEKWNKVYLLEVTKTAQLNAVYLSAKIFFDQIQDIKLSEGLYNSLMRLCKIYCCHMVMEYCDISLLMDVIDGVELFKIKDWLNELTLSAVPQIEQLLEPTVPINIFYNEKETQR